jgi:hypothetical protein
VPKFTKHAARAVRGYLLFGNPVIDRAPIVQHHVVRAIGGHRAAIAHKVRGSAVNDKDAAFGLKKGADEFIRKPFSQRLLVERVKAVLRRAAPRDGATPKEARVDCCVWTRSATPARGKMCR